MPRTRYPGYIASAGEVGDNGKGCVAILPSGSSRQTACVLEQPTRYRPDYRSVYRPKGGPAHICPHHVSTRKRALHSGITGLHTVHLRVYHIQSLVACALILLTLRTREPQWQTQEKTESTRQWRR